MSALPGLPGPRSAAAAVALALIVAIAAVLRLAGLQWDDGTQLHPDERFLTMVTTAIGRGVLEPAGPDAAARLAACRAKHPATGGVGPWLDTACSDWAPANVGHAFYPYGILPLAAVKVAAVGLERAGIPHAASYHEIPTAGRVAATLADLVALLCAYLLGRSLGGRRAGLAAAALYAFAILPLQLARFYTVDPFATAFAALALVLAVRSVERGKPADLLAFGLASGLAAACKLSLAPLLALAVPIALLAPGRPGGPAPSLPRRLLRVAGACAVAAIAAFAIFRVAQPILFAGPRLVDIAPAPGSIELFRQLAGQLDGSADMPPAWQWIGRSRWVDPLRNLLLFGLGPAFAVAAVAGVALAAWRAASGPPFRRRASIVMLAATLGYGAWIGGQFVSSMRYWLPLYPVLAAFGGWALVVGAARLRRRIRLARYLPGIAIAVGGIAAVAWLAVPLSAPTRLWASHWMLERVPAGVSAPLAGDASPLPRRVNWAIDGDLPSTTGARSTRTTVATSGTIDRLELLLSPDAPLPGPLRVEASLTRDNGAVLLAPTTVVAGVVARAPDGFDARDRVVALALPAPITLKAGWKVDLRLAVTDASLALAGSAIATEWTWRFPDPIPIRP